ncbi:MAG: hypothetical protein LUE93_12930 [Bacteroides sp.]|nr:hypothetical protein [Bacteroides sp.]
MNLMKPETLKTLSREEVYQFIRECLIFPPPPEDRNDNAGVTTFRQPYHRFSIATSSAESSLNQLILSRFADLGIYNYTNYLYLDFYEGIPTLYFQYREEAANRMIELPGVDTVEIIYEIFRYTIFSERAGKE